jgi:small subunit ribosomal protein S5
MMKNSDKKGKFQTKEPKEFDEQVIQIDRVTKVVKGGRRLRFRATVAIGNRKGKVGIGVGKSNEVTGAIQKAIAKAKKGMIKVILDGSTVPHELKIKYKSSNILFMPAAPGSGLIAGGTIRKVLDLAGVKDILSKSFGTSNKVNNTKATFEALKLFRETPLMVYKAKNNKKEIEKKTPEKNTVTPATVTPATVNEPKNTDNKQTI